MVDKPKTLRGQFRALSLSFRNLWEAILFSIGLQIYRERPRRLQKEEVLIEFQEWIADNPVPLWFAPTEFYLYMQQKGHKRW